MSAAMPIGSEGDFDRVTRRDGSRFLAVPEELRREAQWVVTKEKVPYQAGAPQQLARVNDPSTFASFDEAVAAVEGGRAEGIGFVFCASDPFFCLDLDDCFGIRKMPDGSTREVLKIDPMM